MKTCPAHMMPENVPPTPQQPPSPPPTTYLDTFQIRIHTSKTVRAGGPRTNDSERARRAYTAQMPSAAPARHQSVRLLRLRCGRVPQLACARPIAGSAAHQVRPPPRGGWRGQAQVQPGPRKEPLSQDAMHQPSCGVQGLRGGAGRAAAGDLELQSGGPLPERAQLSRGARDSAIARVSELEKELVKAVGRGQEPSAALLQRLKAHQIEERTHREAEPKRKKAKGAAPAAAGPSGSG